MDTPKIPFILILTIFVIIDKTCVSTSQLYPISHPPQLSSAAALAPLAQVPSSDHGVRAAYWPSFNGFPASSINMSYFSHIYYAFLLPSPTTYRLNVTPFDQETIPGFMVALHGKYPPIKAILSTGGGGNIPLVFSKMASNKSTRANFINSTIETAREYGFDGVDLDWEFPADDLDMSNLGLLFKEWREALEYEANATQKPRLLLTSAVYYSSSITYMGAPRSYPGQMMGTYVDWINPMCYGYHGSWDNFTGFPSNLYDSGRSELSTEFGIQSWIQAGVPPERIVLGLPLYGPTWSLEDPKVNGVGAPTVGVGPGNGLLLYSQVFDFNVENNATIMFDTQRVSAYSYAGNSWIAYDDARSVKLKVQFARLHNLYGYFFWALGQDMDWTLSKAASDAWKFQLLS